MVKKKSLQSWRFLLLLFLVEIKIKRFKGEFYKWQLKLLNSFRFKRNPFYRIVVADARSPRDGRIIEQIGTYNPTSVNAPEVKIDEELALKWLKDGAKPTDTVHNILSKQGILKHLMNKTFKIIDNNINII